MPRRLGLLWLAVLLFLPFGAAQSAEGEGEGWIVFESANYENLFRLSQGQPSGAAQPRGFLTLPQTTEKTPAVVIVHSIGGFSEKNELWHARKLSEAGFVAFAVDSYGPRGWEKMATKGGAELAPAQAADAFNALKLLAAHPRVDAKRIAIIGFSSGGDTAHFTAFESLRRAVLKDDLKFAAHAPFYPALGWAAYAEPSAYTGAPVLFLLAEFEDAGPLPKLYGYLDYLKANAVAAPIDTIVYAGAYHAWAEPKVREKRFNPNLSSVRACPLRLVGGPGRMELPLNGSPRQTDENVWRECLKERGYTTAFDAEVRDKALRDAIAFLKRAMP